MLTAAACWRECTRCFCLASPFNFAFTWAMGITMHINSCPVKCSHNVAPSDQYVRAYRRTRPKHCSRFLSRKRRFRRMGAVLLRKLHCGMPRSGSGRTVGKPEVGQKRQCGKPKSGLGRVVGNSELIFGPRGQVLVGHIVGNFLMGCPLPQWC